MTFTRTAEQPEWMATLREGDVLLDAKGNYRVVRGVTYRRPGYLWGVSFAIRRCSWTGRPLTVLYWTDLRHRGFTKVEGVRVKLDRAGDDALREELKCIGPAKLTCCAVRGWP